MIKVIDLYSGNPRDFAEALNGTFSGVIFKAGQGDWLDVPAKQPDWWKIAGDAGLLRGWYWVCDSRYHSSKHVEAIKQWRDAGNLDLNAELGLWSDVEYPYYSMTTSEYWKTPYAGHKNVVDFHYLLETNGINAGLYSADGVYNEIMKGAPSADHDYLAKFRMWPANYPWIYIPGISKPKMFGHWSTWTFWQYHGNPDYNDFNGTDEQFYVLFSGGVVPPTDPPPTGENMIVKSLVSGLRIRTGPGTNFPQVTVEPIAMNLGDTADVLSLSGTGSPEQWAEIPAYRWVNIWHIGARNAQLLEATLPPPTDLPTITLDLTNDDGKKYGGTFVLPLK